MNSQPNNAMEKGLTPQFTNRVTATPRQCSTHALDLFEIDLEQHRNDHQPDQDRNGQVDVSHFHATDRMKERGHDLTQSDAGKDAEEHPDGQVAFEDTERCADARFAVTSHCAVMLGTPLFARGSFIASSADSSTKTADHHRQPDQPCV